MAASAKYATFSSVDPSDVSTSGPVHPYAQASWLSRIFFSWVSPLMTLGNTKHLTVDDIWPLQHHHQANVVATSFARDYHTSRSISSAFFASFGRRFAETGVAFFIATVATLVGPLVLNHVVSELSTTEFDIDDLVLWITGMLAMQLIQALAENHASFYTELIAIEFGGALKNMIYEKTLTLNATARKTKSSGDISNLYITDCEFIIMAAYNIHQLWLVPFQILCVTALLYMLLGTAALAGLGVIALVVAINHCLSSAAFTVYRDVMLVKDERIKAVGEAFKFITIIKVNAWEDQILARIGETRRREMEKIWRFLKLNAASVVLMWGMPVFISIATFAVYSSVLHQPLTPAKVFTSISLFQLIQIPLRSIGDVIAALIKAKVAEQRIAEFLNLPELDPTNVLTIKDPEAESYMAQNVIIAIENGSFRWEEESTSPLICDVQLRIHVGELIVIHGPVGCGKSSLCAALIGEMTKNESGRVYVGGSVAYASQQPWIQHMTVRENILFGHPYDRLKYERVLEACSLTQDLASMPLGDSTEIGERGMSLSGGQKARVALARACYSDASVYVLDSPLASLDAIVANQIFQRCLLGLLRHRTIILVTHNPEIIASEYISRALTIDSNGRLVETHRPASRPPYRASPVESWPAQPYAKVAPETTLKMAVGVDHQPTTASLATKSRLKHSHSVAMSIGTPETYQLIKDEEQSHGRVGAHVFGAYYRAVGGCPVLFGVLLSQALWQGFQIVSDLWLSAWSSDATATTDVPTASYRMTVYALLGLTAAVMVAVRPLIVSWCGLNAAMRLFDRMTHALMHAPMSFFDANPIGRILMRYSDDVTDVDIGVPLALGTFFGDLFSVSCSIATTAIVIRWDGLFLLPVLGLYIYIGHFSLHPACEIERVLKTTEAPILSHLSESMEGGPIIRAFGTKQVGRFRSMNDEKVDNANKIWYARKSIARWFGLRVQLLGTVLVFIVAYSLVYLHNTLSAAIIGLAFSYALKVSSGMKRIIQSWSSVETTMVSPERLQQYADVEQEAPHKIPSMDPPPYPAWPSKGTVAFEKVYMRYNERVVLKNVSFAIEGGQKIGIVGRTGAGKSSLTLALFRINELASGTIWIDGVDVGKIGLKALRQQLSIIPQQPVLFKGSLRSCLDPFSESTDEELWCALRRVGLADRIAGVAGKLDAAVEENGENFSVGERQMLCMVRALLRPSRIVVFDEATASIDHETDHKLQCVIREAFKDSTVLTIAHRLDTILDSDKIIVLDDGQVLEYASPQELVKRGKGHFYDLMEEGGYLTKFRSE